MIWLRRRRFCGRCGAEFVSAEYRDGFNRRTGAEIIRSFNKCPNNKSGYPDWWGNEECPPPLPQFPNDDD